MHVPPPQNASSGPNRSNAAAARSSPLVLVALLVGALAACGDDAAVVDPDRSAVVVEDATPTTTVADDRAVLFGPERFTRATGKPETLAVPVAGNDLSSFEPPFVLIVQNGDDRDHRVSSAWVWLDGDLIFGPEDFSQQVGVLQHEVPLGENSTLEVRNAGAPGGFLDIRIEGTRRDGASARIGSDGGTVELDGLASLTFPAGFFGTERTVEVRRDEDDAALREFTEFSDLFRVATHSPGQVRVLIGDSRPLDGTFDAVFAVPDELAIPDGHRPELFAQVFSDAGLSTLDKFQLFPSAWDPSARTLTVTLPVYVFTDERRDDGLYEAIFMIGTTPGQGGATVSAGASILQAGDPDECRAAFILCPLPSGCDDIAEDVASEFGTRPDPQTGELETHWGVDLTTRVNGVPTTGLTVQAAADGTVERAAVPDGNFSPDTDGYGNYLILRHDDGSATLYAHLQEASVEAGQHVEAGDVLGLSGESGSATGPHLHFEYVPNGQIIQAKSRIDPFPCIQDRAVEGDITVRDNGALADDAFAVYLDGTHIGTTDIGAANTFAINNIIPGDHTLRIEGVVVPDNVGTYEVILSGGITFTDGTLRRSGVLASGASVTFGIVVPSQTTQTRSLEMVAPSQLMRPNEFEEGGT